MLQTAPAVSPAMSIKQSSQSKACFLRLIPPTAEEWEELKYSSTDPDNEKKTLLNAIDEICKALECKTSREKTKTLTQIIKTGVILQILSSDHAILTIYAKCDAIGGCSERFLAICYAHKVFQMVKHGITKQLLMYIS